MFTWLQTNLQKHFRLVFIVLLVVLIVAFVFTIGNQGPMSGGNERLAKLYFFDTPLNSEALRQRFNQDANLSAMLNGNMRPSQSLPFERATALHLANLHKVPGPNDSELESFLKTRPIFQGRNGEFDPQAYNMIIDNIQLGGQASEADIRRVLEDDYRVEKVMAVLQGDGFALESEILSMLGQRLAKWTVLVAKSDLNSYSPDFEITEEQLKEHYDEFSFTYQTPVRRSVEYVEIDPTQFVEEIKPTDDQLITYFEENYDRYQPKVETPADGEEPAPVEPVTFEQARLAVRADYRIDAARDLAQERAHDLVIEIINNDLSLGSEGFNAAIKQLGLTLKSTDFFAENEIPIGTGWGRNVVTAAFELSPERFYSEPISTGAKSTVLFYKSQVDPVTPAFDTIREAVARDVRAEQLRKARADRSVELQTTLAAAATGEEAFGAAAEEAGLTVDSYPEFSATEPAEGFDRRLLAELVNLDEGEVSDMVRLGGENQGAYIYVLKKDTPEVDASNEEYAQTATSLNSAYARVSAQQYIQLLALAEQQRLGLAPAAN